MTETPSGPARVEISKKLVMINSASSTVGWLLNICVLIWLQQYLIRRMTPEEYSLLPVLYSVMVLAPLVTTILTGGLGRYIVEAYAKGEDDRVTQIVSTMFPILCATGFVFLAAGWTFAWCIDEVLNIAPERLWDARIMMALLMFSAAVRLPLSPFGVGLFVRQRFVLQNLINVGTEIFRLSILFTLLFGVSTRVMWVVAASVCAEMLNLTIVVAVSRRLLPILRFRPSHIRWPIAKELTSFGGWSFVASAANTVRTSADVIILNLFATPLDVISFHLGSLALRHIQGMSLSLRGSLSPALTAMHAIEDRARLRRVYLRGGRLGLWGVLFVAVPLMLFSEETISLYVGDRYLEAAIVMTLLLSTLFSYGIIMLPQIASATAQMRPFAIRQAAIHLVNLVLTLVLVGVLRMGAVGSALATFLVVWCLQTVLLFPLALRLVDCRWRTWIHETIAPGMAPALAGSAIWGLLKYTVQPENWLSLGLCVAAGCACYVAVLLAYGLRPEDRSDLSRIVETLRPRHGRDASRTLGGGA